MTGSVIQVIFNLIQDSLVVDICNPVLTFLMGLELSIFGCKRIKSYPRSYWVKKFIIVMLRLIFG